MVADTDGYHANEDAALASWSARETCRLIWWVTTIVVVLGVVREVIVGTLGEGTPLKDLFELVGLTVFVAAMALHVAPTHEGVSGVMFCR